MIGKTRLTETDLQLYLAGALPPAKRLLLAWALFLDGDLRAELRRLEEQNASFSRKEMRRLQAILFPDPLGNAARAERNGAGNDAPSGNQAGGTDRAANGAGFPYRRGWAPRGWAPALAGALCIVVLCVLPYRAVTDLGGDGFKSWDEPAFIAKGGALGVNLFVKGDTAYRVEHQTALVGSADTLQVVPLGSEAQHLVLLGWDARQGLVRLFPKEGGRSRRVSGREPPPALLLQDMADNRLICVTAVGPFRIAEAEAALRREPFVPMERAPASHLHKGLYMQVFSISKGPGRP